MKKIPKVDYSRRKELKRAMGSGNFLNDYRVLEIMGTTGVKVVGEFGKESIIIDGVSYNKVKENVVFISDNVIFMITPWGLWHKEKTYGKYLFCQAGRHSGSTNIQNFLEPGFVTAYTFGDMQARNGLYLMIEKANDEYKMVVSGDKPQVFDRKYLQMIQFLEQTWKIIGGQWGVQID